MKLLARASVVLLGLISTVALRAQSSAARAVPQSFDVASVKPNQTGGESRRAGASPGGVFTASNASLKLLISRAYGVPEAQIESGLAWIDTDTWDIAAKADTPLEMTREELRPCLQALLAERFQLRIHHQTKQGAVLSLVVAKRGHKLKEHLGRGPSGIGASSEAGKVSIKGAKTTMSRLAEYLAGQAGRQVVDNTGLQGEYDFTVTWSTNDSDPSGSSVFAAIEEQLGLKLVSARGAVEMIVVDRAARAAGN
jgi:uncharacterized protein (TIGR03435 family)